MSDRRQILTAIGSGLLLAGVTNAAGTQGASVRAALATCGPTGRATAGPFYVSNAPVTTDINLQNAAGTPLRVSALVLGGADARTPLAGATVELWHADSDGQYHPDDDGDISRYRRNEINLRGQAICGPDGRTSFRSIVPAHYGNRRRHLHWRITAPGHPPLVTQTYWRDEKGTPYERSDPIDRDPEECRWVEFRDEDGIAVGDIVFVLAAAR
ncbi:dioxygenase family protein [Aromatoleum sp.]|uniref:dioxygenase family protein n=1 Tax=Aromatoleum sp. TaxID=2307007 RepID=UPI002FCB4F66